VCVCVCVCVFPGVHQFPDTETLTHLSTLSYIVSLLPISFPVSAQVAVTHFNFPSATWFP
jgi:hypothetical protein